MGAGAWLEAERLAGRGALRDIASMPSVAFLLSLMLATEPLPSLAGRWTAGDCTEPGGGALLSRDGTYVEAGGHGRWYVNQGMLVIEVVAPPTITFESASPELLALDADHRLRIIGPDLLEAEAGGHIKRFRRCT